MSRYKPEKMKSQIVFDITGGEKEFITMNLNTLPNKKLSERKIGESTILKTDDIEGAYYTPQKLFIRDTNLNINDIPGTKTKPMVDKSIPPKDHFSINDIDGAKPKIQRQLPHSKRMINPVDPEYELPSYEISNNPIPKFLRDTMKNDDVEGSSPKKINYEKPPKDLMKVDDININKNNKKFNKDQKNCSFDVSDINNDGYFKTKRITNPLTPTYQIGGMEIIDDFGKSKPLPQGHNYPFYSLNINDIEGSKADSTTKKFREFNRNILNNNINDNDNSKPAELLMLPSMNKQTEELLKSQEMAKIRGEKIRYYENRNLHFDRLGTDPIQGILRQQREEKKKKNLESSLTFG